jgi:hypothetical protein
MVRDGVFRKSLPLVDDEDLEEGLSGVAKIGNVFVVGDGSHIPVK